MVAIVGKSGCGKSTLLRLLAGLEKPNGGTIAVDSNLVNGRNRSARLMFQDSALLPWNTVSENGALAAPDRARRRESALEALRQVGLAHRAKDWPAILSGGQRQRIALARALASEARLILFDEPLGALDAFTRLEMQNLIEKLWQQRGFTAILVTHDVEEAIALADRVLLMRHGEFRHESLVSLSRPRDRAGAEFAALKAEILSRVLAEQPGVSGYFSSAWSVDLPRRSPSHSSAIPEWRAEVSLNRSGRSCHKHHRRCLRRSCNR